MQVATDSGRTNLRAKVWAEGENEPAGWQAIAEDTGATRLSAGAAGVRSWGDGLKYFDDLQVTPLALQADFQVVDPAGVAPYTVTLVAEPIGQVLTYTWDFGDGATSTALAVLALRRRGVEFLYVPDTYYETVTERVGEINESLEELKRLNILVDRDEEGGDRVLDCLPVQNRLDSRVGLHRRGASRGEHHAGDEG